MLISIKKKKCNSYTLCMNAQVSSDVSVSNPSSVLSKVRISHLNAEEVKLLRKAISKFEECFYDERKPMTFSNVLKHKIPTVDDIPVYSRPYRLPKVHQIEVKKQVEDMLRRDIIEPSHSAYSSPVFVVSKKSSNPNEKD